MNYLWYLLKFLSFPLPYKMRQRMVTTKKQWDFEKREFQACFGQTWGFEASACLLKREQGRGGRKINVDTKKCAIYCWETTWVYDS